jgi:hypothetical protein
MDEQHRSPTAHSRLVLLVAEMDEQLLRMERGYQLSVELLAKCEELGMINSNPSFFIYERSETNATQ